MEATGLSRLAIYKKRSSSRSSSRPNSSSNIPALPSAVWGLIFNYLQSDVLIAHIPRVCHTFHHFAKPAVDKFDKQLKDLIARLTKHVDGLLPAPGPHPNPYFNHAFSGDYRFSGYRTYLIDFTYTHQPTVSIIGKLPTLAFTVDLVKSKELEEIVSTRRESSFLLTHSIDGSNTYIYTKIINGKLKSNFYPTLKPELKYLIQKVVEAINSVNV